MTDLNFVNKNKRSSKDYTSIISNKKDDMIETTRTKGKRNSKLYYEDELKISPLDNASNRANEIAKEMKNKSRKNKNEKEKENSVLEATFIRT